MILLQAAFVAFAALARARATRKVPEVTEQDIVNFNYMAEHSAASYCHFQSQHVDAPISCSNNACPILSSHNTTVLDVFDGDFMGFHAYTALDHDEKEIVFAVRSVDDVYTWALVSNYTLSDWPVVEKAQAHAQFITPWNAMGPAAVATSLKKAKDSHPDYSMKATGHSLGGSVATLAAAQLRLEHDFPIDIYTFGAPRLGNDHLSKFIDEQEEGKAYRVTHQGDYYPKMPPPYIGYVHISNEYWLNGQNATDDTYPVEDVQVCEGMRNYDCNGHTHEAGFDLNTHFTYFGNIRGCI